METVNLYFRTPPKGYKLFPGDRYLLHLLRTLTGKKKISGVERVFVNLCKSFDELNIKYTINKPFYKIKPAEPVVVLGVGKNSLNGYKQPNPVIAGIGLMTHPNEWPGLFQEYPVVKYLQHSEWTNNIYARHYGEKNCAMWPAGIDTEKWKPASVEKTIDFLVYKKIMWNKTATDKELYQPILNRLTASGFSYKEIVYGNYNEQDYIDVLQQCRAVIFMCEHESQGFACCEAMSMDLPVLAWHQGSWLDPNRFIWGETDVPASSVPFFDENCGATFQTLQQFEQQLPMFWKNVSNKTFNARAFIENNLSLKKSGQRMLEIIKEVYK